MILTRIHISRRLKGQNSLYYTCTRLRGRGRAHTLAQLFYNVVFSHPTKNRRQAEWIHTERKDR